MKNIIMRLGLSIIITLAACSGGKSSHQLTNRVWKLTQLSGKPPLAGTSITAFFSDKGKVSGSAGCNNYSGSYKVSGNKISFPTPLATTLMACDQPVMIQEKAYLNALTAANTYSVSGDQLTLMDSNKTTLAVYQTQPQDVTGTNWSVISYNNGKGAVTSVLSGTSLTASFGKDGKVSWSSGCNTYNGPYTVVGNKISVGPLTTTRMTCGQQGVMDQESQFLAALQSASTYQIAGNRMEFRESDGALAVQFNTQ